MFSFRGEYRRKPVQSLGGGASKHVQRDILIQRAQLEEAKARTRTRGTFKIKLLN